MIVVMIPWSSIHVCLMLLVIATRGSAKDDMQMFHDQQPDNIAFVWGRISNMCLVSLSDDKYNGAMYSTLRNASSGNKQAQTYAKIDWDDCNEMADKDFPSLTFTIIEDQPVSRESDNRALLSLPPGLVVKQSGIPGAGKGVWTEKFFPVGVRFGPHDGETIFYEKGESNKSGYTWIIKCGNEIVYYVDAENERKSNWMRYLNMARKESEQNLKSYQYLGQRTYYTYKPIQPGTELLEFYGFEYGKFLGINMDEYFSDTDDSYFADQHGLVPIPDINWDDCDNTKRKAYPTEPLTIVEDNPLPDNCHNRAKRSVPPGMGLVVKESGIPGAGLGVWTEKFIPAGVRFGPYRGETYFHQHTSKSTGYSWTIYCGEKKVYFRDAKNERTSNWIRYINMPRNSKEENIWYYQHGGEVYYRTFKPIQPDTELLVFYGLPYADYLGIDMDKYNSVDEDSNEDDNIS